MNMRTLSIRRWGVAALTGVTLLGGLSLVGEGIASAATPTVTVTSTTTPTPVILSSGGGQTAGSLTLTLSSAAAATDVINIVFAPASGSCTTVTPTAVTVAPNTVTPTFTATNCSSNNTITLTVGAFTGTSITLTGITVTTTAAATGALILSGAYLGNGQSPNTTTTFSAPSDATVASVTINPTSPLPVVPTKAVNTAIGNITISAPTVGAFPSGDYVCLVLPVSNNFDTIGGSPTVVQGNGAVATTSSPSGLVVEQSITPTDTAAYSGATFTSAQGNVIAFLLTNAGTLASAPSFVLGNLHVDGTAVAGSVSASAGFSTAGAAGCQSSTTTTVLGKSAAVYEVGAQTSGAIYGQTADNTTAAEFEHQFVSTLGSGYSCSNNGNAVLATDADPYDALSAAYLETQLTTGVVITPPTSLDPSMMSALAVAGVQRVYVVGGLLAVSQADIAALQATPAYNCGGLSKSGSNLDVFSGISGATADDTAVAIDNYITAGAGALPTVTNAYASESTYNQSTGNETTSAPSGTQTTAIVVSDTDYQDAAAAAGIAYKYKLPVILTPGTSLGTQAQGELTKLGITQVLALGGQLALTPNVVTSIQAMSVNGAPIAVLRIAGVDETQTAADLALFEGQQLAWTNSVVLAAQGAYWSDSLASAAISGLNMEALVLTQGPTVAAGQYTDAVLKTAGTPANGLGGGLTSAIQVLGGPLAVPQSQITEMQSALAAG